MQGLIANGKRIRVTLEVNGVIKNIGLAKNASWDDDFKLQATEVMGCLEAVSYDTMGYSCSINLGTFVPNKKIVGKYADGGEITILDFLPNCEDVWKTGLMPEHKILSFVNMSTGEILNQFQDVMVSSCGATMDGFVTYNVKLVAVKRIK